MIMFPDHSLLVPLDYTHVLYDPSTHPVGPVLALLTLSPFFLFSAYTAVIVINRPLSVVNLLVGQLGNEAWNGVLKKSLRGERPWVVGDGWGMPSSHSQFLGFSSTFLITHLLLIHQRQLVTGTPLAIRSTTTQKVTRWVLVAGLGVWSELTAYSRVYLHYHTIPQVALGLGIGAMTGLMYALVTEVVPFYYPASFPGRVRAWIAERWERWPVEGYGGFGAGGLRLGHPLEREGKRE